MGQVSVSLNGRTYRLRCGDGEEQRLAELADHVGRRIERLASQFGQSGDERLLLMAALLITDEMLDLKGRLDALASGDTSDAQVAPDLAFPVRGDDDPAADAVTAAPIPVEPVPVDMSGLTDATAQPAVAVPPASNPGARRPVLKRGSLEARLAQARVANPSKTGT